MTATIWKTVRNTISKTVRDMYCPTTCRSKDAAVLKMKMRPYGATASAASLLGNNFLESISSAAAAAGCSDGGDSSGSNSTEVKSPEVEEDKTLYMVLSSWEAARFEKVAVLL